MFAGAVVVQGGGGLAGRAQVRRGFFVVRDVRAAEEIGFVELALAEKRGLVFVGTAELDERNRLKRLCRRPEKRSQTGITGARQKPSGGIDDGDGSCVERSLSTD